MAPLLIPLVELDPWRFAAHEHPTPAASMRDDPAGWDAWWRLNLADADVRIEPFRAASFSVTLSTLMASPSLGTILARIGDHDADPPDEVAALEGGFALMVDGAIVLEPQCCSDLGNLDRWWQALASGEDWQMLWIGHPWSFTRLRAGKIEIAELSENAASATVAAALLPDELLAAVVEAGREVQRAATMLVDGHGSAPKMERSLVDRMLGLDAWSESLRAQSAT